MPPTQDVLTFHTKRAKYQAAIHRRSLQNSISAPSPHNNGWLLKENELFIHWMSRDPAPQSVLLNIRCKCGSSRCHTKKCSCLSANLSCTDMFLCQNCDNMNDSNETSYDSDDED